MSEQTTEGAEEGQTEDNKLIQGLREQIKTAEAKAKAATEASAQAVTEAREQVKRESQVTTLIDTLGFKGFDTTVVLERVEGDVTAESVTAVFEGLGLKLQSGKISSDETVAQEVSDAADLGARVAAAASGGDTDDVSAKLNKAETIEELNAIAADAGFLDQS